MLGSPLRYERLTWSEIERVSKQNRVALIPAGTLEDHGPHLPIDTDVAIASAICRAAAEQMPDETILLPPIVHGYSPHHMDFPGTITIAWDTFCRYCVDVATSLIAHGFSRILFVNGHGSNQNLIEMAARLAMVDHPEAAVAACFYLTSPDSAKVIAEVRESDRGGMAHACELETSIYLHLDPDAVAMDKAVDERGFPETKHSWLDWSDGPLKIMPWWSSFSDSGVQGDATLATAEKGHRLFDAAVEEICTYAAEVRSMPLAPRRDRHGS